MHAGLLYAIPTAAVARASAFGWMLAYPRGPAMVSGWIETTASTFCVFFPTSCSGCRSRSGIRGLLQEPDRCRLHLPIGRRQNLKADR
jgi:hypothetical protein